MAATRYPAAALALGTLAAAAAATSVAADLNASAVDFEPNQDSTLEPIIVEAERPPGFWDGSTFALKPRAYYLTRDRDENPDNEAFAVGGALEYKSGWWQQRLQAAATLYTSQKIYGPSDKDGTLLLKPGQESFTVLGEANLTLRFVEGHGMRVGRQRFELPYLGSHDIRMVPNTFEAIAVGNVADAGFAYMAGYVDRIKLKNDDEFISMSEAAGAAGSDEGVAFAGARYLFPNGTLIGAINQYTFDVFNTLFAKVEHQFPLTDDWKLGAYLQYTDQRSVGDDLIGDFDTSMGALKLELKHGASAWRVGYSTTDDEKGIQKPYGNPANYLSVIVNDFDRAGEDAWLLGLTHDFGRVGIGNLSTFANVVYGDTPDSGPSASPDQTEYNLTVDYRMKDGWTDRLWLRVRAAYIDQDEDVAGGDDYFDFRIIVNYDFSFP